MEAVVLTLLHLAVTAAKLCRPGGVRAVIAENLLLKQQLIVLRRPRQRAPNLTTVDCLLCGFGSLFLGPGPRPDGSSELSYPSGHTSGTFASATVLKRHFGWKVGIPAFSVASYVGASRLALNRHYLSDVVFRAAIGIAAGRTITFSRGAMTSSASCAGARRDWTP